MAPSDDVETAGVDSAEPDPSWELLELAPVLFMITVTIVVVGSIVTTTLTYTNVEAMGSSLRWLEVASALRWVDPASAMMLLLAGALVWWQYGQRVAGVESRGAPDVGDAHVARLRRIAGWLLVSFAVMVVAAVILVVASFLQVSAAGGGRPAWGLTVSDISYAVGSTLVSGLGLEAMRRVRLAASGDVPVDVA